MGSCYILSLIMVVVAICISTQPNLNDGGRLAGTLFLCFSLLIYTISTGVEWISRSSWR
jgi:uncharacterized transporter YbjL